MWSIHMWPNGKQLTLHTAWLWQYWLRQSCQMSTVRYSVHVVALLNLPSCLNSLRNHEHGEEVVTFYFLPDNTSLSYCSQVKPWTIRQQAPQTGFGWNPIFCNTQTMSIVIRARLTRYAHTKSWYMWQIIFHRASCYFFLWMDILPDTFSVGIFSYNGKTKGEISKSKHVK